MLSLQLFSLINVFKPLKNVFNCAQYQNIFIAAAYRRRTEKEEEEELFYHPSFESVVTSDFHFNGWPTSVLILKR